MATQSLGNVVKHLGDALATRELRQAGGSSRVASSALAALGCAQPALLPAPPPLPAQTLVELLKQPFSASARPGGSSLRSCPATTAGPSPTSGTSSSSPRSTSPTST